nr:energy transducer TonB [Aulosira sp. DedVER01a]
MGFSSIAVAQREKEAKALKSFLTFSLVSSLILHIAVLASGITNLLTRVPEVEEEPIELTLVEPTDLETPKPLEEVKPSPEAPAPSKIERSIEPAPKTQASVAPPVTSLPQPVIKVEKPVIQQPTTPERKVVNNSKLVEKTTVQAPQRSTSIAVKTTPVQPSGGTQKADPQLRELLSGIRNSNNPGGGGGSTVALGNGTGFAIGNGTGKGIGNGSGNGVGNGIGNGIGNGSGNGIGNGIGNGSGTGKPVATAPTSPRLPGNSDRDSNGSGNGRAACRECRTKYPEAARRRGIEGRVEVAVDTDDNGNVTSVRIARSSGNRDLDEETLRQAREWKLKPAAGGRQGVSIATEFAIQGSRRHREVQERKRQAQAAQKSQPTAASNASSNEETPRRRRRVVTSTNTENTGENTTENRTTQRRSPTPSSEATENRTSRRLLLPRTETPVSNSSNQSNLRESLRRRRESVANTSKPQPQPANNRRRRRTQQPTSPSQSKLIDSLRRSRQPSPPPDAPATSGN